MDGKTSDLLGSSAAVILNALKELAGIDHRTLLISPEALEPITRLKTEYLGSRNPRLHSDEVLTALSISAAHSEAAKAALEQLPNLRGLEIHCSVMLSAADEKIFRKLGMHLTCEPQRGSGRGIEIDPQPPHYAVSIENRQHSSRLARINSANRGWGLLGRL